MNIQEKRIKAIKKILSENFGAFLNHVSGDIKSKVFNQIAQDCVDAYDNACNPNNNENIHSESK